MNNNLISIIGAIMILAIVIFVVYFSLKKKDNGSKEALEFLNGLKDELIKIAINTAQTVDPSSYKSAEEFELVVLNEVYDKTWDYVQQQIKEKFNDSSTLKLLSEIIDKDYVINFIDNIYENFGINQKIQGQYASYQLEHNNPSTNEEKLKQKFSDKTQYNEESTDEDLEPAKEVVLTEEEASKLNPQKDEEEEFNIEDDSMEIIQEEEKPNVIRVTNKSGQTLYYEIDKDGKKKRVTKEYALSILGEDEDKEESSK